MAVEYFQLYYLDTQKYFSEGSIIKYPSMLAAFFFNVIICYVETELNTVTFTPFIA